MKEWLTGLGIVGLVAILMYALPKIKMRLIPIFEKPAIVFSKFLRTKAGRGLENIIESITIYPSIGWTRGARRDNTAEENKDLADELYKLVRDLLKQ